MYYQQILHTHFIIEFNNINITFSYLSHNQFKTKFIILFYK